MYPENYPRNEVINNTLSKAAKSVDPSGQVDKLLNYIRESKASHDNQNKAYFDTQSPEHASLMMDSTMNMSAPLAVGSVGRYLSQELLHELAVKYNIQNKLGVVPSKFQALNPKFSKAVAEAYDGLIHNPNVDEVKKAYDALTSEVSDQFQLLKDAGLRSTPSLKQKYKNSTEMIQDVTYNNHVYYHPTAAGFGGDLNKISPDHPMLKDVNGMNINDQFRVVHDVFGHAKPGTGFGPVGEEKAYQLHKSMLSPEAQKALTSETRGQNSWVNFGPHGQTNKLSPEQTIYAEQKAGILPDWARGDIPQDQKSLEDILNKWKNKGK